MTGVDFTQDTNLDLIISGTTLAGSATISGVPNNDGNHNGSIQFSDLDSQAQWFFTNTREMSFSEQVLPGAYRVYYSKNQDAGAFPVPANTNAALTCIQIP